MDFVNFMSILCNENEHPTLMLIKHKLDTGEMNINEPIDFSRNTMLHAASNLGKPAIVQYLLKQSADVNATSKNGDTPLHAAIKGGNIPVVKLLLDNGSNVNQKTGSSVNHKPGSGITSIMIAIPFCTLEMLKLLLDYGADINLSSAIRVNELILTVTPLDFAIRHFRIDVVQFLIDNGANVNVVIPELNDTPLHTISRMNGEVNNDCEIAELLIESGANLNAKNMDNSHPLNYAIVLRKLRLVELFVKRGSDLSFKFDNNSISTPFHLIITNINKSKYIDLCLKNGADYGIIGGHGFSAYHLALLGINKNKQTDKIIQTFWQHGCPYDLPFGCTYSEPTKNLLHHCLYGTDGNVSSTIKYQRMMFEGIQCNNVKTVKYAIKSGAVARGTSMDIKYPLHFVSSKGYTHIAKVLLENGIKVNNLNDKSETALQLAIKFRKINVCKLLFKHGACLNFKTEIRNLDAFVDEPSKEIKDLLLSIYLWFSSVKLGNCVIFELMKDLLKTDKDLFLLYLNALDKNKRSLMASAMYYGHGEIVGEIMKNRLLCKQRLLKLPEL